MDNLTQCSKHYKSTMNKFISKYNKQNEKKLRHLQSKSPKEYWKFIHSLKSKTNINTPTLEEFYEHFKILNSNNEDDFQMQFPDATDNNEILNCRISADEILRNIKKLNNGKASGLDRILNEHIKSSSHILLPVYEAYFNIILDTGVFPEQWSTGCIHPIYKNKGDRLNAQNYRPITILSCLGKLFTSILNTRLNEYLEESMLLSENQAGFRKNYSTNDHIFSLYSLIEIFKSSKQKLFCGFIDFSSAFDSVWRVGLWSKLLKSNINGKVFNIIYNMYQDIKSCVSLLGENSTFFSSYSGVRQGENLSPVLFSIFLNDLESSLMTNSEVGVTIDYNDTEISIFMRLVVLLYADDTVIVAKSENDLQYTFDRFYTYCQQWKLKVNASKTKVVIFGAKKIYKYEFRIGNQIIEVTDKYKYLGIYFSQSRSFLNARKHIVEQAKKAMYLLFFRINNLNLPIDLQLKLFDHTVLPILTYSCEIWGFENVTILEKVHIEFLRKITKCRKSTPLNMLYAELGRYPLEIVIKSRIIGFWNRLIHAKQSKIAYILYLVLKNNNNSGYKWISNIRKILNEVGRNDLWVNQHAIISSSLKFQVKQILYDQFLQNWRASLNNSSKGRHYNIYKDTVEMERYFVLLPKHLYLNMVRFRTANHKLPIETGRWNNIDVADRKCTLCEKNTIGDEFHYLLECPFFKHDRQRYIHNSYYNRPNILKYKNLLLNSDENCLLNLSKFMGIIIKQFT